MAAIILSIVFNLLLLLNPNKTQVSHGSHARTSNSSDEMTLLAFKSAIAYDPLNSVTTWSKNVSFCKWVGVLCSSRRHRIVSLNLHNMSLEVRRAFSPKEALFILQSTSWFNSPALCDIHTLRVISLLDNHLSGNISSQLGFLPNLELIVLGHNNLTGTIPNSLGNLSSLDQLDLGESISWHNSLGIGNA
ncbi:hypothetical protein SUGI_0290300 [Cryptomeria japonica]|nr:hypothetical protein SUGI_0290300 [Cryptomeria japonica]